MICRPTNEKIVKLDCYHINIVIKRLEKQSKFSVIFIYLNPTYHGGDKTSPLLFDINFQKIFSGYALRLFWLLILS